MLFFVLVASRSLEAQLYINYFVRGVELTLSIHLFTFFI